MRMSYAAAGGIADEVVGAMLRSHAHKQSETPCAEGGAIVLIIIAKHTHYTSNATAKCIMISSSVDRLGLKFIIVVSPLLHSNFPLDPQEADDGENIGLYVILYYRQYFIIIIRPIFAACRQN